MRTAAMPGRGGAAFLLAGGLLAAVLQGFGLGGRPVYDGLPVPADPYRYLVPPAGVTNPGPPLSAHVTIDLVGGGNSAIDLPTGEFPPQAELWLYHGDVNGLVPGVPPVATARVTITPVYAPAVPLPAGRQFHGNVYALSVVANGHKLTLYPHNQAMVALRQPKTSAADPQIAILAGNHWQLLDTHPADGAGVLAARLPDLGDVTILERTSGFVAPQGHSLLWLWTGLGLFAIAAVVVVRVRRIRGRPRETGAPTGAKPESP
jgi:hypothetical protein